MTMAGPVLSVMRRNVPNIYPWFAQKLAKYMLELSRNVYHVSMNLAPELLAAHLGVLSSASLAHLKRRKR
jgi:hypothetical protein